MRLCSILGCALLAGCAGLQGAGPERRADKIASVVRADREGRLVRTVRAAPRPAGPAAAKAQPDPLDRSSLREHATRTAERYEIDPALVLSVIEVESNYDPLAVSPKGARGLMQLMPATAARFAVRNSFDPWENVEGGVRYLKHLLGLFGHEALALAAYNAGEGAVAKYGGIPPFRETTEYIEKVGRKFSEAKQAAAEDAPAVASAHPQIEQFVDSDGTLYIRTRPAP